MLFDIYSKNLTFFLWLDYLTQFLKIETDTNDVKSICPPGKIINCIFPEFLFRKWGEMYISELILKCC